MNHWLMKTEPSGYSLDDLIAAPKQTTPWDGVRNYQARNFMRQMDVGDAVLFYHSGKNPAVVALTEVASEPYPDPTQFDEASKYFDPKSTPENPRWDLVDVRLVRALDVPVTLKAMKADERLAGMQLLARGNRLSVLPVEPQHYAVVLELAGVN